MKELFIYVILSFGLFISVSSTCCKNTKNDKEVEEVELEDNIPLEEMKRIIAEIESDAGDRSGQILSNYGDKPPNIDSLKKEDIERFKLELELELLRQQDAQKASSPVTTNKINQRKP